MEAESRSRSLSSRCHSEFLNQRLCFVEEASKVSPPAAQRAGKNDSGLSCLSFDTSQVSFWKSASRATSDSYRNRM